MSACTRSFVLVAGVVSRNHPEAGVFVDVRHRTDRECSPMQHLIIDLWTQGYRMPPMKHALQLEVSKVMPSYPVRRNSGARTAKRDSARIQGGNWSMQTFRRSGHVYDEGECQMSIDEFMAERGLQLDRDDA